LCLFWPLDYMCESISCKATKRYLPYEIKQCYLPPETTERILPWPQPDRTVGYSTYLRRTDRRLSWPRWMVIGLPRRFTCRQALTHPSSSRAQRKTTSHWRQPLDHPTITHRAVPLWDERDADMSRTVGCPGVPDTCRRRRPEIASGTQQRLSGN